MDYLSISFNTDEHKVSFPIASDTNTPPATSTTGMQSLEGSELLNMLSQQEPSVADAAPFVAKIEEMLTNVQMNGSGLFNEDASTSNYFTGFNNRSEIASSQEWPDHANIQNSRSHEMDTFDFLVKSLSSADNYVSRLTREQLAVLRSIRPSLLYDFLQEIAMARSDRRTRRALPNECAFCKNNGENKEFYSTHCLKDWHGRVLCPVLRAFRCPRCGATGDKAHTIKYCPQSFETGYGGLPSRRRAPPSMSLLLNDADAGADPSAPSSSPVTSPTNQGFSYSTIWSNFGLN